jgi:methionyl-tRNA synthetase
MVFGQDADFNDEAILTRYNADLANDLGNLVSRATTMIHRYCDGVVPAASGALLERPPETELRAAADSLVDRVKESVKLFQFSQALREIWDVIGATNRYIVAREPWALAKDPMARQELATSLYVAADTVRMVAELLRPFIPSTSERMLQMLGVTPAPSSWAGLRTGALGPGSRIGPTHPLFPRIEHSVEELRAMSDSPQPVSSQPAGSQPAASQPAPSPAGTAPSAPTAAAPASAAADASRISIDDFMKVELRVARILAAERVPKSNKLLKLQVDVGTEQRTLVAGIAESYEPDAIVGRTVVIVFNLKPAKLMGIESNGMVLAASAEGGKPTLAGFDQPPDPGTRVR